MPIAEITTGLEMLSDFARRLKRDHSTVRRWATKGVWNVSRTRKVFLKTTLTPQGKATCEEFYAQFIRDLNKVSRRRR
ncbi:hypothetical protein [Planctomicrobium piriforme]|uniref:Uncharacterized protein n=1 Tax=Planctomicrobium piriforme TaxID=1576369 RepID=A0A1I3EDN3_9PLAN|nr:hypothetical protein [Planctomicrobium piriforme]SFH97080.1 hypothetical protein SAMN05421753_104178 [Planctomicrobium piriforme]